MSDSESTDIDDIKSTKSEDPAADDLIEKYKQIDVLLAKCGFFSKFINAKLDSLFSSSNKNSHEDSGALNKKRKRGNEENQQIEKVTKHIKLADVQSSKSGETSQANKVEIFGYTVDVKQPVLLDGGTLRDYQLHGLQWLMLLFENGLNGILADEMGLGKTIQIIAFLCHLYEKNMEGPYLIIGPLSTLSNWKDELNKFASLVPCVLYHGTALERLEQRKDVHCHYNLNGKQVFPVVITSYQISIKDKAFFSKFKWKYLIVDEGHCLKNYKSVLSRTLSLFPKVNCLLLTGTPLQNNLRELWSLLHFILPTVFDELGSFNEWLAVKDLEDSSYDSFVGKKDGTNMLSSLHKIIQPFILRRVKNDVALNLPPKKEIIVYCPLSENQVELTMYILEETNQKLIKKRSKNGIVLSNDIDEEKPKRLGSSCNRFSSNEWFIQKTNLKNPLKCNDSSITATTSAVDKFSQFKLKWNNIGMMLRKVADHPVLLQHVWSLPNTIDEEVINCSGKMIILDTLLLKLKDRGHKVLLFSNFTSMLDIIEDLMYLRGHLYERLDGSVNIVERQKRIKNFSTDDDIFVFLISTHAGGLGINLVQADTVVLYDSDWNPQVDLQAQDRCHRIGQKKPVIVYRLVSKGTIDEQIVNRATSKLKLERLVMPDGSFKHKQRMGDIVTDIKKLKDQLNLRKFSINTDGSVLSDTEWDSLLDRNNVQME